MWKEVQSARGLTRLDLLAGACRPYSFKSVKVHSRCILSNVILRRKNMKLSEDWLAVIIGFVVIIIGMLDIIDPAFLKF